MPCKNGRPLLYEQFLTNVVRTGMQDFIVPLPHTQRSFFRAWISAQV
ncbi:MAG: hypothetical protein WCF55_24485 [Pseudolabrys sp.]